MYVKIGFGGAGLIETADFVGTGVDLRPASTHRYD